MRRPELELIVNWVFFLGPAVLSLAAMISVHLVSSAPNDCFWIMVALYSLGFILFVKAKLSLILGGKRITFGPKEMSPHNRALYIIGYTLMALALFLMLPLRIFLAHI